MANHTTKIPTIPELISSASAFNYTITQPNNTHTCVHLLLDSDHPIVPLLAQYAVLISAGLEVWEASVSQEVAERPDFSLIPFESLLTTIGHLEQKPCRHYRGWIGEIITHFLLHHFVAGNRDLLEYDWEAIQPPKMEVTDGEIDIVAAYELRNQGLGHISGEVKTYKNLSQAKSKAYNDLEKARTWSNNRDAQIRSALNALLRPRYNVGAVEAATSAMGNERSFLPSLIHCTSTRFIHKPTFDDLPQRFNVCTRATQLIGIQIVVKDFGDSCDASPLKTGFFENFLEQMRHQAIAWKSPAGIAHHV